MKRNKLFLALSALALLSTQTKAQTTPPVGTATQINVSWTAAVPTSQWPLCSSTVSISCIQGYNAILTPPPGVTGTNNIGYCSSTVLTNCITEGISTNSFVFIPGGPLYTGVWGIQLWTVALDQTGNILPTCVGTATPTCTQIVSSSVAYIVAPTTISPAPNGLTVTFSN